MVVLGSASLLLLITPFAFQANTPAPTNPQLALVPLPAITAYVSSFNGYESDTKLEEFTLKLVNSLNNDSVEYVKDFYFTAGYDPPYRIIDRHNEVWLLAAN